MNKFLLIDGNNLKLRAMHGTKDLYDAMGNATNCLFTSLRSLILACYNLRPQYVLWFWDKGRSEYRRSLYPSYKLKTVGESDESRLFYEDWKCQIDLLDVYLPHLGIRPIGVKGVEADDLIYLTTRMAVDYHSIIFSSDHDFLQLVSTKCSVFSPHKQVLYNPKRVREEFGVKPTQWPEYRALTGDPSDNIEGVPKVGPVRASEFINRVLYVKDWFDCPKIEKPYDQTIFDHREVVLRNIKLMDLAKLPLQVEVINELEEKLLQSVDCLPSKTLFWEACVRHQMSSLLEDAHLWPFVFGAKNDYSCQ